MKRFLMLTVALAIAMTFGISEVEAQRPIGGPQVGNFGPGGPIVGNLPAGPRYGFRAGGRRGLRNYGGVWGWNDFYNPYSFNRPENQPYFAMNPPVYYSDQIVPRPMGISPFPAPPGVTPVEMTIAPQSETVVNPFFERRDQPVAGEQSDNTNNDSDT